MAFKSMQEIPSCDNGAGMGSEELGMGSTSFKGTVEELAMITNFKRFKRKGSSSRFKGVFYVKKERKFRAQICLKGKKKYVGTFKSDAEAALARDKRIREIYGEVEELLNFPLSNNPSNNPTERGHDVVGGENVQNEISFEPPAQNQSQASFGQTHVQSGYTKQSVQNTYPGKRSKLANLNRYGSSSGSLTFPNFHLPQSSPLNLTLTDEAQIFHPPTQPQTPALNQPPNTGESTELRPFFGYNPNYPYNVGYDQQWFPSTGTGYGTYNNYTNYGNYSKLVNFNLQDQRKRAALAKRFSSGDLSFPVPVQGNPVSMLSQQTGSEKQLVGAKRKNVESSDLDGKKFCV